jgi:hypothetical protein
VSPRPGFWTPCGKGTGTEAAERIVDMKKLDMAEAAEQLLALTG